MFVKFFLFFFYLLNKEKKKKKNNNNNNNSEIRILTVILQAIINDIVTRLSAVYYTWQKSKGYLSLLCYIYEPVCIDNHEESPFKMQ